MGQPEIYTELPSHCRLGSLRGSLHEHGGKEAQSRPAEALRFAYRPSTKLFNLKLSFTKHKVDRLEIIDALEAILRELRES